MRAWRIALAGLAGAGVGLAIGVGLYLVLAPWLESQTGSLREMQGLAWNLVPVLTLLGAGAASFGAWSRGR